MNVFDLFAKLSLDKSEYEEGLDSAEKSANGFGEKLKKGIGTAAKVVTGAVVAGAGAVAKLTQESVKAYADYEQLVGGVETLFGAGGKSLEEYAESVGKTVDEVSDEYNMLQERQKTVLDNAANAYKDAGLSANQYMETVTSFAAALNSSLGENADQSAKYAQSAIVQMADNANKMGTSIESIQNAYMGFSKQNFQMLDNLKIGYGGTRTEMERLLRDAEELAGYTEGAFDVNNFADIVEAIGIIQDNLGISGTTANEAATTISGSVAMMKSAWSNLVAGMADDQADFDTLINNMVESVDIAGQNIMPRVEKALNGVASLIEKLAPMIAERLPDLISQFLPGLLNAATDIVNALIKVIPDVLISIAKAIVDNAPILIQGVMDLILNLVQAFPDLVKTIVSELPTIINSIVKGLTDALPTLIPSLVEMVLDVILALVDNIDALVDGFIQLMTAITEGLINALPVLIEKLPEILVKIGEAIITNLPILLEAILNCLVMIAQAIWNYLGSWLSELGQWFMELIAKIGEWLSALPEKMAYWAGVAVASMIKFFIDLPENLKNIFNKVVAKVKEFGTNLKTNAKNAAKDFFNNLVNGIKDLPSKVKEIGKNIVEGLKNGFMEKWNNFKESVSNLGKSFIDGFKGVFGIHSPSTVFKGIGNFMSQGLEIGWDDGFEDFQKDIENVRLNMDVDANATTRVADVAQKEAPSYVIENHVYLEGEAEGVFRLVRQQNRIHMKMTGRNQLATS